MKRYLNRLEMADEIGCCPSQVTRLRKAGDITGILISVSNSKRPRYVYSRDEAKKIKCQTSK